MNFVYVVYHYVRDMVNYIDVVYNYTQMLHVGIMPLHLLMFVAAAMFQAIGLRTAKKVCKMCKYCRRRS